MSGILSYIRTVGSKAQQERILRLISLIESGNISLDDISLLLNSVVWSHLPQHIKDKIINNLSRTKAQIRDELSVLESNASTINEVVLSASYSTLRTQYNSLNRIIMNSSIFMIDGCLDVPFVNRINKAFSDSYTVINENAKSSLYANKNGDLLFHQHDDKFINEDPIITYKKALEAFDELGDEIRTDCLNKFDKGQVQTVAGDIPEFDTIEKCASYLKEFGITLAPYDKLKPIPKGVQREHIIPHSCFFGDFRQKGQARYKVPIADIFGSYTENNALCIFVDDAQKAGTEHKILTDADRNFAKALKNNDNVEQFATVNEWLAHKEKQLVKLLEAGNMKRPPSSIDSKGLDSLSGEEKKQKASFAAKAIIQGTRLHLQALGADLNAKMSNRIARGSIAEENFIIKN